MVSTKQDDITAVLGELTDRIERAIDEFCSTLLEGPNQLKRAMRYSLDAGGKRLRPALTIMACQACGGTVDQALAPAVAIEMVHTFSLIHDDLPAMDDDDMRRGKPTNHKVFGEAMAILAGDAMLIFAFDLLARGVDDRSVSALMVAELARAAGSAGMTGGQVLDMAYDSGKNGQAVNDIHLLKTAAMIKGSAVLGGLACGANDETIELLGRYGTNLGLAFQVVDDMLDVTGDADAVGKRLGKDAEAGKPNYAVVVGVDQARDRAEKLTDDAIAAADAFGEKGRPLAQLAQLILDRQN